MAVDISNLTKQVLAGQAAAARATYETAGVDLSGARFDEALSTSRIEPWPGNRELSDEAVGRLAADVERNGILQPVLVRPMAYGRYQLLAGHHRLAALESLAKREPDDPRWRAVPAYVMEMDDEQAERAVLSTNVYMIPLWTAEERGAQWMRMSEMAEERRKGDPEAYRGVRTNDIVLEIAREMGVETSAGSIIRDKKAYRQAAEGSQRGSAQPDGLSPDWAEELSCKRIGKKQARALAELGEGAQDELFSRFSCRVGDRRRWLDAALTVGDEGRMSDFGRKAYESVAGDMSILAMLAENGYEVDTAALRALLNSIDGASRAGEGRS